MVVPKTRVHGFSNILLKLQGQSTIQNILHNAYKRVIILFSGNVGLLLGPDYSAFNFCNIQKVNFSFSEISWISVQLIQGPRLQIFTLGSRVCRLRPSINTLLANCRVLRVETSHVLFGCEEPGTPIKILVVSS